jgi:hypothetical protein
MRTSVRETHRILLQALSFRDVPQIHTDLAQWPMQATPGRVGMAEAWLLALLTANDRLKVYDPIPFRQVIRDRWFLVCLDSWHLGRGLWHTYRHSPLYERGTPWRTIQLLRRIAGEEWNRRKQRATAG